MAKTKCLKEIQSLYNSFGLNEEDVWHRTKTLLSIYRKVVWSLSRSANNLVCEQAATYGRSIEDALKYLAEFAPQEKQEEFENRVRCMFETKWIIDLIDKSLVHVRDYPERGELYYTILYNVFLKKEKMTDNNCMGLLHIEKTMYYQRKKEAIYLMGIALWGYAIPEIRKEILEIKSVRRVVN